MWSMCVSQLEPLNRAHIGASHFVLCTVERLSKIWVLCGEVILKAQGGGGQIIISDYTAREASY